RGNELWRSPAAELGILGEPVPAVGAVLKGGGLEPGGRLDRAIVETARAFAVADRVQRIEDLGREPGRLGQDRGDGVRRSVLEAWQLADLVESGELVQHELHFLQRRVVLAHVRPSSAVSCGMIWNRSPTGP